MQFRTRDASDNGRNRRRRWILTLDRAQDTGFNLKAGFMFGEPRSDLNPIPDPTAAVPDPDVSFSVPRQFDEEYDDNLQYWGRDNTNYLVGEGYLGAGRRRR